MVCSSLTHAQKGRSNVKKTTSSAKGTRLVSRPDSRDTPPPTIRYCNLPMDTASVAEWNRGPCMFFGQCLSLPFITSPPTLHDGNGRLYPVRRNHSVINDLKWSSQKYISIYSTINGSTFAVYPYRIHIVVWTC